MERLEYSWMASGGEHEDDDVPLVEEEEVRAANSVMVVVSDGQRGNFDALFPSFFKIWRTIAHFAIFDKLAIIIIYPHLFGS